MSINLSLDAKSAGRRTDVETSPPGMSRPDDRDHNSVLYGLGRRVAERVARHIARGLGPQVALRRVAADLGLDVAVARSALRFREAVDRIANNVGPAARRLLLGGHRHLAPGRVMQIGCTHPERQRSAMDQVARGRHPFAKPLPGVAPPFDTRDYGEVRSRLARTAGALDWVANGLADTPPEGWPAEAKLVETGRHLQAIREHCRALRAELCEQRDRVVSAPAPEGTPVSRRRRRSAKAPAPLHSRRALTTVAAARGIAAKNVRDVPRLLREHPMTGDDLASLLDGLHRLGAAADRLIEVVGGHISKGPRPLARRSGRPGRASAGTAVRTRGVHVEEAPEGPAALGGSYIVVFRLVADATVAVGALGTFDFPPGHYAYVGSAFGPGGVRARTGRHRTPVKEKMRWNVDFLTPHVTAIALWWTHDTARRECLWSAALAATPGIDCPAPEFGARDCRKVPAPRIGAMSSAVRRTCTAAWSCPTCKASYAAWAAWCRDTPRCSGSGSISGNRAA